MPAPKMLSGLPKPLLFGLYGAIGGLIGALALGEPILMLIKAPAAEPLPPQVAVSASATVQIYPRSENTFPVQIVRERFDTSVAVKFGGVPPGATIRLLTLPAGQTSAQGTVVTTPEVAPGEYKITLTAEAEADGKAVTASGEFKLIVLPTPPPPPAIAIAVPPNLSVYKKGTGKFIAAVNRRGYDGPISITVAPLPAGVTAEPATIPANGGEVEVTLKAADTAALANVKFTVTAEATAAKLKDSAPTQLLVQNPPVAPVDIVFVLDVTASMQWAIDDLKNGIGKFADTLTKNQVNFRLGLVTFRDLSIPGETVDVIKFKDGDVFTASGESFRERTETIKASGGGDIPESSLEGVVEAAKMPFRQGATRILLLITDAPPKIDQVDMEATLKVVKAANIDSVHLVIQRFDLDVYKPLLEAGNSTTAGKYFNLGDIVRGDCDALSCEGGFDSLLETFGKVVTAAAIARSTDSKPVIAPPPDPPKVAAGAAATPKAAEAALPPTVKSLQSSEQIAAGSEKKVVLRSAAWTGAIAALVCLALLAGQHHYLRGSLPAFGGIAAGLLGGLIVGFVGGAAGEGLNLSASSSSAAVGTIFRVLGWTLLGGFAGVGLSLFIPNMKWYLGLAGGAIGGAAGAAGFIAVSGVTGDVVGRLVGGLLLGFWIGLMVAIVEAAFRKAWLEVRFGARETINVNLGPEPVKIGGDSKACTVWARGAAPVALRFFVRDGQVVCDDAVMKRETAVSDGFSKEVGNVTVTVHTGTGTASPPPKPQASSPVTPPAKPRVSSDDDDFDPLPMAMSPPPAPPKPVAKPKPVEEPMSLDDEPAKEAPEKPQAAAAVPKPPTPPVAPAKPQAAMPPKPPAPPVAPAKPQAAAPKPPAPPVAPDACPGCGRVNAGKPKQRYCMVCDNTY